jgi:hypothetical protein
MRAHIFDNAIVNPRRQFPRGVPYVPPPHIWGVFVYATLAVGRTETESMHMRYIYECTQTPSKFSTGLTHLLPFENNQG